MPDISWHGFALCLFMLVTQGLDIYEATFSLNLMLFSASMFLPHDSFSQ